METENKYKNGKVYSLRSHQTDDIYVGSTINELAKRIYSHKQHFKQWQKRQGNYITSFEIIKFDDCYIELLENFPCNSRNELCRREGELIRANKCVNKHIAGLTHKETTKAWYEAHKDDAKRKSTNYNIEHADKLRTKHNCECGGRYKYANVSIHNKTKKHLNYINNSLT